MSNSKFTKSTTIILEYQYSNTILLHNQIWLLNIIDLKKKYSEDMSMVKYASLTGFKNQQMKEMYRKYLEELGFNYSDTLLNQKTVLIASSVLTQKYKVYQTYRDIITCVKIDWLIDSYNSQNCLDTSQYQIRTQFYGAYIGICGFETEIVEKIQQLVQEKGGKLIKILNVNNSGQIRLDIQQNVQVMIIPQKILHRFNTFEDGYQQKLINKIPFVGIQWIQNSLKMGFCRYPLDYAYNYLNIRPNRRERQQIKLCSELQKGLNRKMIQKSHLKTFQQQLNFNKKCENQHQKSQSKRPFQDKYHKKKDTKTITPKLIIPIKINTQKLDKINNLFQDCFIYFHHQIENSHILVSKYLKPLVCMNNGIYIQMICPVITHIIVDKISQNQYFQLMKFGSKIPILRVQWVIDTILYGSSKDTRMKQDDYLIRSFKDLSSFSQMKSELIRQNSNSHSYNISMSFKQTKYKLLYQQFTPSQSTQYLSLSRTHSNHSSISMPFIQEPIVLKKKVSYRSKIFQNVSFYIPLKYKKQKQLKNIVTLIRENGGAPYDKPKINKIMHCVMLDGPDIQENYKQISKGYQQFLRLVSYRWIKYCVKRQVFVQSTDPNYFIFQPFKFITPIFGFLVCKFQIVGVNDGFKTRIRQLLDQMGSKKCRPCIMEMTHCLCSKLVEQQQIKNQDFQKNSSIEKISNNQEIQLQKAAFQRINEIKNANSKVKFIKLQWIFDCVKTGQMLSIQEYKLNNF